MAFYDDRFEPDTQEAGSICRNSRLAGGTSALQRLSSDFSEKSLTRVGGITMVWTSNLLERLTFDTDTRLRVFRHALALRAFDDGASASKAYEDIFTITLVTYRSIGIGAYLVRLGHRAIQVEGQPITLTVDLLVGHSGCCQCSRAEDVRHGTIFQVRLSPLEDLRSNCFSTLQSSYKSHTLQQSQFKALFSLPLFRCCVWPKRIQGQQSSMQHIEVGEQQSQKLEPHSECFPCSTIC
jgi:hypothetical protein